MDAFMCYGPVVPDGYGACYNPHPENLVVCISSFRSCDVTSSGFFASTLESSLLQMRELCLLETDGEQRHSCTRETPLRTGEGVAESIENHCVCHQMADLPQKLMRGLPGVTSAKRLIIDALPKTF